MSSNAASFAEAFHHWHAPEQRLCVGIDPHPDVLVQWGLDDSASGSEKFATGIIDAVVDARVSLVKPQVALFERHGVAGMRVLAQLIGRMRALGIRVIADAKRGDIGTSLQGYASAWLAPGSDFESDAVTLSPYLGVGALEPAFTLAKEHGKGVFVLAATSNPEGQSIQSAVTSQGVTLAQSVLNQLQHTVSASQSSPGWLGAVVGATINHESLGLNLSAAPDVVILAPGFGHQGAQLGDLHTLFGDASSQVIPTVSRSVAGTDPDGVATRLAQHLEELRRVHP
ncbi:orotidine-5'-phosphate decarboxylase [Pontimonas salivibrio]|uniref:Orotidine-5'-phosphate decarboxylase n=1 Tax=Pontimonas salivibrio TaxID=1159327 RepID=A0A2L2BR22_9MICO|nr:orotidine-5'-phosphate decarboxylase [Pontimonas salivibrio]AVG24062.1 orotidine-5'-phosphate decarboxylase [Pontimonas salivibrio]